MRRNGLLWLNALVVISLWRCETQAQDALRFARPTAVLTIASSGVWGVGVHDNAGTALSIAMKECRSRDLRTASDCGAQQRSIQNGWLFGMICGGYPVIGYGPTLAAAEARADEVQALVRREWRPDLPACERIAVIEPDGRVDVDRSRMVANAP